MAYVRPFRALRYAAAAGPLGDLVAPPYDVISRDERRLYLAASPYNAVRLILPELPYEEVGGLIASWQATGVIGASPEPVLIAWTQSFTLGDGVPRERRTILGAVGLEPYERRVVRPHERTHAGPVEDRLRLTRAVRANLSPVFGLYRDPGQAGMGGARPPGRLPTPSSPTATGRCTASGGWPTRPRTPPSRRRCATAGSSSPTGTTATRRPSPIATSAARRRAGNGSDAPYDRVLMGLTALEDPGLVVLPTHRVLTRWPEGAESAFASRPVDGLDALRAALADAPEDAPALGLVRPDGMRLLTGRAHGDAGPGERLDAAVLEREILVPHLGTDQAALTADGALGYTVDAARAARLVASGEAAAALVLRPIPKAEVAAVAEAGETMPQKSTYFFPKLLTGVAFHSLVDV